MMLSRILNGRLKNSYLKKLIENSGLFDPRWYAEKQGLRGGAKKALGHFLKSGGEYDPSARFSSGAYLFDNADVRAAGLNPLLHYLQFGIGEGRVAKDIFGRVSGAFELFDEKTTERLRAHFDQAFYQNANPDLHKESNLFAHFMRVGWRQNRDPTPWFSVQDYLTDNNLIGQNPFAHYLLSGAELGCRIRSSRQSRAMCCKSNPRKRMRLAAVSMVRNEADIVELFTSHLLAFFDDIVIVDHQSDDGTAAFLTALADRFPQIQVLTLCEPSYIQSIAMTHVVRVIPSLRSADWVFFLDADEFLPFQTRNAFHHALEEYRGCPIISMRWRNVIPVKYWSDAVDISETTEFFLPPAFSPFKKIAFQPSLLNLEQTEVAQGNHALTDTLSEAELRAFEAKFHLLHVPIRSEAQLALKLKQGVRSYDLLGEARDQEHGAHWQRMARAASTVFGNDGRLNALAVSYSEDGQSMEPISRRDLIELGFSRGTLSFAKEHTGLKVAQPIGVPKVRQSAELCSALLRTRSNGELELVAEREHVQSEEGFKSA